VEGTADARTQPFVRGVLAPYEQAGSQAVEQVRRQVPRGGSQDLAVTHVLRDVALQRGQAQSQMLQRLMDYYASMYGGYAAEKQIGQEESGTRTTKEPFLVKLGSFASIPIG
jgi:hypothetical protein